MAVYDEYKKIDGALVPVGAKESEPEDGQEFTVDETASVQSFLKLPNGKYARTNGGGTDGTGYATTGDLNALSSRVDELSLRIPLISETEPIPPAGLWYDTSRKASIFMPTSRKDM